MIETLTLTVGGAVARSLLKLWFRDEEIAQSIGLSITELAERGAGNFLERRSLIRSFDRVAEEVARKVAPFLEAEFRDLDEGEVKAAVIAAQETIDAARLDDSILFATDLEPLRLEAALRAGIPNAAAERFLSTSGSSIYDFTMREAANYLAEMISTLPKFQSRATRELLERDTTLIALVEEVLERLPSDTGLGGLGDPDRFEAQYRREVARKLDRLELFGVRTNELNQRYRLSVAYIGLTASSEVPPREARATEMPGAREQAGRIEHSIEATLTSGHRHLIRGEAGSGKTTLLQWLAVSSARREFGEMLGEWNDTVPFFIQLRRFVGEDLPQPAQFPATINRSLGERMSSHWAGQQMEQGRALVLIDGVDELREDERAKAAEWLSDLIATYPDARYVVTSRPPAVPGNWLAEAGLSPAFLEPMDVGSIDAFIEHWHDAAGANTADREETEELGLLASRLQTTVRMNSQIRGLATSPLLCAMLCALNRDWKGQLPKDRVELYRIGLEMLLERRDVVREVGTEDLRISRTQKEVLLQSVAYWLMINGFSDAKTSDIENLLGEKIEAMPHLEGSPAEVLKLLLLRSGLLREPVEGRIDFIHRTFQEYLTAKQIVDDRSVGLLVERATEDQWQEVVTLAAGLGTEDVSQDLVRRLLERAELDEPHRHRLQLLAVACLETTPVLPKELQDEIQVVLEGLIPPRSMSEAKAIASAGEVAVPLLAAAGGGPVTTVAPTVRALGLIGGPAAMVALEEVSEDQRLTVARELVKAWDFFPTEEYARRVLRRSSLEKGALGIADPDQLASIPFLEHLTDLTCFGRSHRQGSAWDWSALARVRSLRSLTLNWAQSLADLDWPEDEGGGLESLTLVGCPEIEALQLSGLDALESLRLAENPSLADLPGLSSLPRLSALEISGSPRLSGEAEFPSSLSTLMLSGLPGRDLRKLAPCTQLRGLTLSNLSELDDINAIAHLQKLDILSLFDCKSLLDLSPIATVGKLSGLNIWGAAIESLDYDLPDGLLALTVGMTPLASFESAPVLRNLQWLALTGCADLTELPPLGELEDLGDLVLHDCTGLRSLDFIAANPGIRRIHLEGCRGLRSLEPLHDLPRLESVDIRGCSSQLDPSALLARGVRVLTGQAADLPLPRQIRKRR